MAFAAAAAAAAAASERESICRVVLLVDERNTMMGHLSVALKYGRFRALLISSMLPRHSLRAKLLVLMTDIEPHAKRFATELLFELCDRDTDEFTTRCGFGNAIAFLQTNSLMGGGSTAAAN
jgi:hypothetical protein